MECLSKKVARDGMLGALVGDGLDAVLAELENLAALVRAGPRAALAIEAALFVDLQPRLQTAPETHFADREARALVDRRNAGGDAVNVADARALRFPRPVPRRARRRDGRPRRARFAARRCRCGWVSEKRCRAAGRAPGRRHGAGSGACVVCVSMGKVFRGEHGENGRGQGHRRIGLADGIVVIIASRDETRMRPSPV